MERSRPVRNRRHSRRNDIQRPIKRLFTPDIKRMLKDWLVRRRQNPYPSREEKKALAVEAGLTYTQICNWFANWRRKLKNSSRERNRKPWGHLIKNYNTSAKGNVEQFSISSDDSIWGESEEVSEIFESKKRKKCLKIPTPMYDNYYVPKASSSVMCQSYLEIPGLRKEKSEETTKSNFFSSSKFKSHIMEKYLKGLEGAPEFDRNNNIQDECVNSGPVLSKWIESAANFTPSKNSYIEWCARKKNDSIMAHQREEIEAAEALSLLALNFKTRFNNDSTSIE